MTFLSPRRHLPMLSPTNMPQRFPVLHCQSTGSPTHRPTGAPRSIWCAMNCSWTATRARMSRRSARPTQNNEVRRLMDLSIDKNMIDKDEYPQTAEIEMRCVHMLADLWHANKSWKTTGCSTTGSSEACMLGGLALKWQWKKRMQRKASRPTNQTSSVARCRCAGRNSPATSTSRCAKCH